MTPELAIVGAQLRAAGLTPRALAAWAGTDRLSALPPRLVALAARPVTRASAALAAYVAGVRVPELEPRALPDACILPLGPSLLVCDRADAPASAHQLCWPDDSSYHLARAIPSGRRARWLDLGSGSAFAPLLRPELASAIDAVDLNPRAADAARHAAALSGIGHLRAHTADLADAPAGPYELVTCNAPIPGATDPSLWRRADASLFARLWSAAAARVAPGGVIVVHGARSALRAAPAIGERVIVTYTPAEAASHFGVLWWRPDVAPRAVEHARALTAERPHVDAQDREAALAGSTC